MTSTIAGGPETVVPPGRRVLVFFRDIRIAHSVFAAPFALAAALVTGELTWPVLGKIVLALFLARTSAMAFNRIVDAPIDARCPRTSGRAIPSGSIRRWEYVVFFLAATALFVAVCGWIHSTCLLLAPIALAVLLGYSLTKRFTWATHLVLGLALGLAPVGAWIAVTGGIDPIPFVLAAAVLFWVAGFDVIYACMDVDFDRREGLHSIPARLGVARALRVSSVFHILSAGGFFLFWALTGLGPIALGGVILMTILLAYEHRIVAPGDLSRAGTASFTVNGVVSLLFLAAVAADLLLAA